MNVRQFVGVDAVLVLVNGGDLFGFGQLGEDAVEVEVARAGENCTKQIGAFRLVEIGPEAGYV